MINSKQRSILRKLAHNIEPLIFIGKGGITDNVIKQTEETLLCKELVKFTVMKSVDQPVREICDIIAQKTNADPVQVIGRKFILYRKN